MPKFIRFTDRDGRAWRVYEFSVIAGQTLYAMPGNRASQYRGFVCELPGVSRRRCLVFKPEDRVTDVATLQRQLDLSTLDYRDDPRHPTFGHVRETECEP